MKLNKANNSGSISIVIPKEKIKQLGWKRGDDCVMVVKDKQLIIIKQEDFEIK